MKARVYALIVRYFGHMTPREFFPYLWTTVSTLAFVLAMIPVLIWGDLVDFLICAAVSVVTITLMAWRAFHDARDPGDEGWERAMWGAVEGMNEKHGEGDPLADRLWADVMLSYPMRDTDAACDYLVQHAFDECSPEQLFALIDAAPDGARTVLRALFVPPTEEKPW